RHNDKKNSILNIVSHDLVGPLSFIRNIATILSRELKALNNFKFDKFISIIYKTSEECIDLIRDFLNVEFLESSEVRLLKKRVDLAERICNIIAQYQEMQGELKKQFHFKSNKKSIYVEIDDEKFMQVINNLISNALKFTHDNGVINILMNETQTEVQITVTDNGIGIPERYQNVLFDKFSKARRRGLKDEHSTGLGMYIIKTIIDWHQGTISFESKEGQGSSFYITLPK
ncbi:MAG TPA: HAMP domain-containing sensor histidine kinase, partial [Pseudosphingobacterium sp.]|nr:HAMP domain-containing sensor histidine kinase [Pseudosphingobacterium sp.]